jgi:hypothetical protein
MCTTSSATTTPTKKRILFKDYRPFLNFNENHQLCYVFLVNLPDPEISKEMLRRTFRRLAAAPSTSVPKGEVPMSTARGATGGNDSSLDKILVAGACGAVIAWQAFGPEVIAHH